MLSGTADRATVHDQPSFFPWHRYFLDVYEKALHDCGYSGTIM
jgi:hypothetical protein